MDKLLITASVFAISIGTMPSASWAQQCPPQTRVVVCLDHRGEVVADSVCLDYADLGHPNLAPKPAEQNFVCGGNCGPPIVVPNGDDGGGCCFIAGTAITMADGSTKNIEDIVTGDEVIGFDNAIHTVLAKRETTLKDRSLISINGGLYFATCDHTFKSPNGWVSADPEMTQENYPDVIKDIGAAPSQMDVGTVLCGHKEDIAINTLEFKHDDAYLPLYDLSVTGDHTYLANGYVVHNAGGTGCPPQDPNGGGGGSKVLCGHYYTRGILPHMIYAGDLAYAHRFVKSSTKRGYHLWAVPLTKHLNENPNGMVEKIVQPFVIGWATEMAYRTGYTNKGHWLGKIEMAIMEPIVSLMGTFAQDTPLENLQSERAILRQQTLGLISAY
jgi:hypothetical protein